MDAAADQELVERATLGYFDGWDDADATRMDRALHDDLAKRWAGVDDGSTLGRQRTKAQMLELTAAGGGRNQGAVSEREHLHLVRTPTGWKIVNAFWQDS